MDEVIKEIIETEKISRDDINTHMTEYMKVIEKTRKGIKERGDSIKKDIFKKHKLMYENEVQEARKIAAEFISEIKGEKEKVIENIELTGKIRKRIISILLE